MSVAVHGLDELSGREHCIRLRYSDARVFGYEARTPVNIRRGQHD